MKLPTIEELVFIEEANRDVVPRLIAEPVMDRALFAARLACRLYPLLNRYFALNHERAKRYGEKDLAGVGDTIAAQWPVLQNICDALRQVDE